MTFKLFNIYLKMKSLLQDDEGQDLIEYSLVAALIALAAAAGMKVLGTGISTSFSTISSTLASSIG